MTKTLKTLNTECPRLSTKINNFHPKYEPTRVVRAVFYNGGNLSEVAKLGVDIKVENGQITVLYGAARQVSYKTTLTSNSWVVANPFGDNPRTVGMYSEGVFPSSYVGPLTEEEVRKIDAPEPEHQVSGPESIRDFIYGDNRAQIVEKALEMGREFYGDGVALKIEIPGTPLPSSSRDKGKYCASVTVSVAS